MTSLVLQTTTNLVRFLSFTLPSLPSLISMVAIAALGEQVFAQERVGGNILAKNITAGEIDQRLFQDLADTAEDLGPVIVVLLENARGGSEEAHYLLRYGVWLTKQGSSFDALGYLTKALELVEGDAAARAAILFHQGIAYLNLRNFELASSHFHKCKSEYIDAAAHALRHEKIDIAHSYIEKAHQVIRLPKSQPVGSSFDQGKIDLAWAQCLAFQNQNFDVALEYSKKAEQHFLVGRTSGEAEYLAHSAATHALVGYILTFREGEDQRAIKFFRAFAERFRDLQSAADQSAIDAFGKKLNVDFDSIKEQVSHILRGGENELESLRRELRNTDRFNIAILEDQRGY
jgi:tetratricopeptide (TPR) repeat protein